MAELHYTPDEDLKVHEEGAIRLICKAFQSHEDGLPEWLKNAADAYARTNWPEERRVIVVIVDHGRRSVPSSISCLDFVGMTSLQIERDFRNWADPDAARRGASGNDVQGGHGNGGKCYMTQMFDHYALLHTVQDGKACKYGVASGSVRFGYIPDRDSGRDYLVSSLLDELDGALHKVRASIDALPTAAQEALRNATGFTLITGVGPKGYDNRVPVIELVESLQGHPQMVRTIELCSVYCVVNGQVILEGNPLRLPDIPPMAGAELPRVVPIPTNVTDPTTGQQIPTGSSGTLGPGGLVLPGAGVLILKTSDKSMRWSRKWRHVISFKSSSGYIGYVGVSELDIQSPYRDRIYGDCTLDTLDPFKQNDRGRLARSPLTRGIDAFISAEIQKYAEEFEARERRRHGQEEKNAISRMNEALDRWKNKFLSEMMRGIWGSGSDGPPPPPPPLPSGPVHRIDVSASHRMAGLGVSFRPTIRFFDIDGRQVRAVPYQWVSEDESVALVDPDLHVVNTFSIGSTELFAETLDKKVASNRIPIEVVLIKGIRVTPEAIVLPVGSRSKLEAICRLADGQETSDVYLYWIEDNAAVARVSSAGLVFGVSQGQTHVTAGDEHILSSKPAAVEVTPGDGTGKGKERGRGFPLVLVSGDIDRDPDTNEFVQFSSEDPPVWQRPQDVDRNIWWINSAAPLAQLYLDKARGFGYDSREWRMYHLERYVDVIVQIALTQASDSGESLPVNDWIMRWGERVSNIQQAAAGDLASFLVDGELPF